LTLDVSRLVLGQLLEPLPVSIGHGSPPPGSFDQRP